MNRHPTDDELLDRLYGLSEDDGHLETCGDCALRWNTLRERRAELAAPVEGSTEFLAGQRRKIYARLGEPGTRRRWVPAVAAACLLAIALLFYRPSPAPRTDAADAQLFSEVYSMEESTEPQAAAPIHALFEDDQQ